MLTHQDVDGLEIALKYKDGKFKVDTIEYFSQDVNDDLWEISGKLFGTIERVR